MGIFSKIFGGEEKPEEKKVVRVRFFDADSEEMINNGEFPCEDLPENFEAASGFSLEGEDWKVTKAEPLYREEYCEEGGLDIWVRRVKVETVKVDDIKYMMPTIHLARPELDETERQKEKALLDMHEDEWRQLEFLSASQYDAALKDLEAIREVWEKHSEWIEENKFWSFTKLHPRQAVPHPLEGSALNPDALRAFLTTLKAERGDGVSFSGYAGIVRNSFVGGTPAGRLFYGQMTDTGVQTLGMFRPDGPDEEAVAAIVDFMKEQDLLLVDWRSARLAGPEAEDLRGLILGQAGTSDSET